MSPLSAWDVCWSLHNFIDCNQSVTFTVRRREAGPSLGLLGRYGRVTSKRDFYLMCLSRREAFSSGVFPPVRPRISDICKILVNVIHWKIKLKCIGFKNEVLITVYMHTQGSEVCAVKSVLSSRATSEYSSGTLPLTNWLTNFTELSPWETASCSATQKLPRIIWNPMVLDCVHKSRLLVHILSQMTPTHTTPSYYSKVEGTPRKLATATSEQHHRFQAGNWFTD
jgi:hypothetical protein